MPSPLRPRQRLLNFAQPGLLVDCHGTISSSTFWTNLGSKALARRADAALFGKRRELIDRWMLGLATAEEVHRVLASELDVDFDWLWKKFTNQAKRIHISGLTRLAALRNTFRVALVTVNVDAFSRFSVPSKKLNSFVDVVINSADWKSSKTDDNDNLLIAATDLLSCDVDNSILIDDKERVCRHFANLGGHSICIRSVKETLSVLSALEEISTKGIRLTAAMTIQHLKVSPLCGQMEWNKQVRSATNGWPSA